MKILVTGGSGFIGSNLCKRLLNNDNIVYCLDDFSIGKKDNIKELIENKNFHIINHDIRKDISIYDIDQIYNLASPAAPADIKNNSLKTLETNIFGTKNILELAKKLNIPVLHISTIRIFENNFPSLSSSYIEGKRVSEMLCSEYKDVRIKILRLNNIYGPNMSICDSRVVPQFITRSILEEDIIVYGDGTQIDSFCYIDDIIDLFIKFMNSDVDDIFNVTGVSVSIIDLAKLVIEISNSRSKIQFIDSDINSKASYSDNLKLKENFNWRISTDLKSGLLSTVNYYHRKIITDSTKR